MHAAAWKALRVSTLSAKGHKLNRRGRETRQAVLDVALRCLAEGNPDSVSANLIAKEAGVTWGTVQHQFGDTDGLWAAVLDRVAERVEPLLPMPDDVPDLGGRVAVIVDLIWNALEKPSLQAIYNLRATLPRDRETMAAEYPRTAVALAEWDRKWERACREAFAGIAVDAGRLHRVRSMLPAALRGLNEERYLGFTSDVDAARQGLAEACTAYLSGA